MVSDCIIKCSKHYPTQNTRIISYNLSYSCTSSSNRFRHHNYTGKYWSQFFCRLDRSAIGQHRSLYKMCIRLRHPYRFSNSGMPALVFRPENLNHGDILCRPSWPSVSMTQVYTIRLRDTGLYHSSHGHRSVPSVSRTQVCTFRLTDTGLYHPSQGHRSVPSVSGTQVCTIRLWHISLWHPSWPSPSGTSISAFFFQGKQSAPFLLAFRLGNIRLD